MKEGKKKAKQNNNQAIKRHNLLSLGHRRKPLENDWRALTRSYFEVSLGEHYYKIIISV